MSAILNNQTKQQTKPQFSPYQKGVEKALKETGYNQSVEALQAGVPPQHIEQQAGLATPEQVLQQLLNMSQTPIPEEGTITGILPAIFQAVQGKGFKPMAPKKAAMGIGTATQVMGLQQSTEKQPYEVQKLKGEVEKQPYELQTAQTKVLQDLIDFAKGTGNRKLFESLGGAKPGGELIEVDPMTGQLTEKGKRQLEKIQLETAKALEKIKPETTERIQMGSNLDALGGLLDDMEKAISADPNVFIKGLNPFAVREFKAIMSVYDKTAAIAAGGKQLTRTELNLIRSNRPTLLDFKSPKAIAYKINKQREIILGAKNRLDKLQIEEKPPKTTKDISIDEKYQRYLQILKGK